MDAKLSFILYEQEKYGEALALVDALLVELKKLDDKQLLVETHLVESKIHHGLRGLAKAKAALTASRTCANAIYVAPTLPVRARRTRAHRLRSMKRAAPSSRTHPFAFLF